MHALGVYHEHTRPDRDNYLRINLNNVAPENYKDFKIKTEQQVILPRERFDFWSIMLYGPKAFSMNGKNTIISKVKGQKVIEEQMKKSMSVGDVELLRTLYKCDEQ